MATKGSRYLTFRDILAGTKPDGNFDTDVVELIAQENLVLQDIPWKECSKGREDFTTIRTGMPAATFRMFYEGVAGSKSTKKQVVNSCGTCSTSIEFDYRLFKQAKDQKAFLTDEQRAHADALGQTVALALFYGDIAESPKGINGFGKTLSEYGSTATTMTVTDDKKSAFYVYSAGGEENLRSIFLCGWGAKSCHGIYPEGSSAGIQMGTVKEQYVDDGSGKMLAMGIQEMNWDVGLNIRDYRYCGRIGNIDIEDAFIPKGDTGYVDLTTLVRRLVCRVKSEGVTQRLYMPRIVFEAVTNKFAQLTQENAVRYPDLEQKKDGSLLGVPVSFCDCMNIDEPALTAAN